MESQLSRSEKKRRAKGIEQLVAELAALPMGEIGALPCDQEVRHEIKAVKSLKGGSRKRQLKYAAKLLRDKPVEELYEILARKKGSQLKEKREFQELEYFRNLLLSEALQRYEDNRMAGNGFLSEEESVEFLHDSKIIPLIVKQLPEVNQAELKNSAMQFARTRNRKFSREIFRIMKGALEKAQFRQKQDENNGI